MSIQDKLITITENIPKVYEAGITEGKKVQYDAFWDAFQINGTRTSYYSAFDKYHFNSDIFYPKYDIRIVGSGERLFYGWSDNLLGNQLDFDLSSRLQECGVVLDTSKATSLLNAFAYTRFSSIPTIDVTALTSTASGLFSHVYGNNLYQMTIEKIIVNETTVYTSWFSNNTALKSVRFDGTIANTLSLSSCYRLDKASITNVVEHLSTTTSGISVSFSKTAVDREFETDAGAADGSTSAEWQTLIGTRSNWTITLS